MPGLTCNACNSEFVDDVEQKLHYKSEWHRYNLKRKVAGVPGVTETLFLARQTAVSQENSKSSETPMLYSCGLCGKGYRSSKAHAEHLKSRSHITRASGSNDEDEKAVIKPLVRRTPNKISQERGHNEESDESEDEWEEVDPGEDLVSEAARSMTGMKMKEIDGDMDDDMDDLDDIGELDPSCCFMCDLDHDTIESCMVHMHKQHGFFIPDVDYFKDPAGLLAYLGLKVKRDFMCLYCNDRRLPFNSLEAVRKHMSAKSHCKVHYGDGDDDEDADLKEFYDYSSSYVDEKGKKLIVAGDIGNSIELGSGGSELIITQTSDGSIVTKTLGSREFLRYYRQKPRPANYTPVTAALASRYKSMGLATVQSREGLMRMKVMKAMSRSGVEAMRTKIGLKNNVIRNLPKNVPY